MYGAVGMMANENSVEIVDFEQIAAAMVGPRCRHRVPCCVVTQVVEQIHHVSEHIVNDASWHLVNGVREVLVGEPALGIAHRQGHSDFDFTHRADGSCDTVVVHRDNVVIEAIVVIFDKVSLRQTCMVQERYGFVGCGRHGLLADDVCPMIESHASEEPVGVGGRKDMHDIGIDDVEHGSSIGERTTGIVSAGGDLG